MAKTPVYPSTNDDAPEKPADGKGRATPTRAQQEAARRRPLVANTKEAKAAARAELNERRSRAQSGMAAGEEKYLPARDKGPQRRWVRDYVDAGWHPAEFMMGIMVLIIIVSFFLPSALAVGGVASWAYLMMAVYFILAIGEMIVLGIRVKRKVATKFGQDRLERGLGWYAGTRSLQMRFMRLPKPQVKRGEYPD